jgi:hypothetical protein
LAVLVSLLTLPAVWTVAERDGGHRRTEREQARREGKVVVEDYTSAAWDGIVAETVEDFRAAMPQSGIRLDYVRKRAVDCFDVPAKRHDRRRLVVCVAGKMTPGIGGRATAHLTDFRNAAIWVRGDGPNIDGKTMCHEMLHVMAGVAHQSPEPVDYCDWAGELTARDVAYLQETYSKKKRR